MMDLVDLMRREETMLIVGMKMRFDDDYEHGQCDSEKLYSLSGISQYSKIISSTEGSHKYLRANKNKENHKNGNKKS